MSLLSATNPWLAGYFQTAHTLLDELDGAARCSEFAPECLSDQELASLTDRLMALWHTLPSEHDENVQPPLEAAVLGRAIFMLCEFLETEMFRRKEDPAYATYCKESHEVRVYRDTHNGEWPQQGQEVAK